MFWFLIIFLLNIAGFWLNQHQYYFVSIDVCVLLSLGSLFLNNQISIAITAWSLLKREDYRRQKLQFNLAIVSDIFRLFSFVFAILWFLRWYRADSDIGLGTPHQHDLAYLNAFLLCTILSYIMDAKRLSRLLQKVQFTSGRQALIHFIIVIFVGAFLLMMPFSIQHNQTISLIDAFFLSVSALSVTGLSPVDISTVLTGWGLFILLILIQLGGLGVVMLTIGLSVATSKRLSMNSIFLGQDNFLIKNIGDVRKFLVQVVAITFAVEFIGAFLLYISFPLNLQNRVFSSIFHSVSAFCNAGFSLYASSAHDSAFTNGGIFILCVLIIMGGIGFPVIIEIGKMINHRKFSMNVLSPQTLLAVKASTFLLFSGALMFFVFDSLDTSSSLSIGERLLNSAFYSVSSRTAGFSLYPLDKMSEAFQFLFIILMVIGASPSSTGGGIKTTTVGILYATVKSVVLSRDQTVIYGRSVPLDVIRKSLAIIFLYLGFAGIALMILIITENLTIIELITETVSALSTVGSSLNVTARLSVFGKIVIMLLMLIGRFGILSLVMNSLEKDKKSFLKYPEDNFNIG